MAELPRLTLLSRITGAIACYALAAWWVLPHHAFDGPVVAVVTEYHGVHSTDWPALLFVATGYLLVRRTTGAPHAGTDSQPGAGG